MTLRSEIRAVQRQSDVSYRLKRELVYALKGRAYEAALTPKVGKLVKRGRHTIKLIGPPVYYANAYVGIWVEITKDGHAVPLSLPIYLVNPAVSVPQASGGYREDVWEAFLQTMIRLAH